MLRCIAASRLRALAPYLVIPTIILPKGAYDMGDEIQRCSADHAIRWEVLRLLGSTEFKSSKRGLPPGPSSQRKSGQRGPKRARNHKRKPKSWRTH